MKNRCFIILLLLLALAGLCYFGGTHTPWLKLSTCLKQPEKYDGRLVTYIREPRIEKITSDGFILSHGEGFIPVQADTLGLKENEYIGLTAVYHQEGYLEAVHLAIARNRRYKIILSVFPVILVAVLFFRNFRINWKEKQIEIKNA